MLDVGGWVCVMTCFPGGITDVENVCEQIAKDVRRPNDKVVGEW